MEWVGVTGSRCLKEGWTCIALDGEDDEEDDDGGNE